LESFKSFVKTHKKINIFDFDDTLCFTDSKIRLKTAEEVKEFSPKEFHELNISYNDDSFEIDFSDFKELIKPKLNNIVVKIFKERLQEKEETIILTARAEIQPIYDFFKKFNLPKVKVFSSEDKGAFILNLIDKDKFNDIEYYDDHTGFINDAKYIRDIRPKINFKIYLIDAQGIPNEI